MKTFEELGLMPELLQAIAEMGYEVPMPVQEEVIPYLLGEENDIVALAQTGTGKTAAYGLPILQKIDIEQVYPQALVLCPTRELCLQIADDLNDYSKYLKKLSVLPVYGGSSIESQIRTLKKGVHVLVATPGRLIDLMNRHCVDLSAVNNVILDEADEMLTMGFSESIDEILAAVPENRNTLLFSATMPNEIAKISKKYMRNPHEIVIGKKNESTANVRHVYYMVQAKDKYLALKRIADYYPNIYGIVFCRTRKDTQEIADKLIQDGYNADALHGDLSQAQRDYVMQKFRLRNIRLLVATDVAARGLDVDDLTHIINYALPDETEVYTHRSGRTGRAGKTGISISIIHLKEKHKIRAIEKQINKEFTAAKIPSGREICAKQVFNLMDRIEKVEVNEAEIAELLPQISRKLEWLDKDDLIKRMVSLEFNRLIRYYQEAKDIQSVDESPKEKKKKSGRGEDDVVGTEAGFSKLFINLGKMDGITPKNLLNLLNDNIEGRVQVGRMDFFTRYSLFDVDEQSARRVVLALRNLDFFGRPLRVDFASEDQIHRAGTEKKANAEKKPYKSSKRNFRDDKNDYHGRQHEGYAERPYSGGRKSSFDNKTYRSGSKNYAKSYDEQSLRGKGRGLPKGRNVGSRKK